MTQTVELPSTMSSFSDILTQLPIGHDLILTKDQQPFAVVTRTASQHVVSGPGSAKSPDAWMSPEFNDSFDESDFDSPFANAEAEWKDLAAADTIETLAAQTPFAVNRRRW